MVCIRMSEALKNLEDANDSVTLARQVADMRMHPDGHLLLQETFPESILAAQSPKGGGKLTVW
jgi:hypothetical protein